MGVFGFISVIITLAISLSGVISLQRWQLQKLTTDVNRNYEKEEETQRLVLKLQSKTPRLGFNNLWADWNYLQYIQYFGDNPARDVTGYTLLPKFFETIVKEDPRFVRALLSLSTANTLYGVSPKTTVKLLNQALAHITPEVDPLTPYVWSYKGVDEMLFLAEIKAAQNSYQMGADWALKTNAEDKEAVAKRNQETADFLANNPDSKKARVAAWMFILGGAINENTQKLAIKEIISLGGKISVTPEGNLKIEFPEED